MVPTENSERAIADALVRLAVCDGITGRFDKGTVDGLSMDQHVVVLRKLCVCAGLQQEAVQEAAVKEDGRKESTSVENSVVWQCNLRGVVRGYCYDPRMKPGKIEARELKNEELQKDGTYATALLATKREAASARKKTPSSDKDSSPAPMHTHHDPLAYRLACRSGELTGPTTGSCDAYLQANVLILPQKYASVFRDFCRRYPQPCPLIDEFPPGAITSGACDESSSAGRGTNGNVGGLAKNLDIRTDLPMYQVFGKGGVLVEECARVDKHWRPDLVTFLLGCSFSFEAALAAIGLVPKHQVLRQNVPMYDCPGVPLE